MFPHCPLFPHSARVAATLVLFFMIAACGGDDPDQTDQAGSRATTAPARAASTTTAPGDGETETGSHRADPGSGTGSRTPPDLTLEVCPGLEATAGPTMATTRLSETSGVVASQDHPGVVWAHNDSGHQPVVVASDLDGHEVGAFLLPLADTVDIEDIALHQGMLYLADIGDNDQVRPEVAIYRFPEPDPSGNEGVNEVETFRLRYPDGPHDAEAFLVDPGTGELVIVDKTFGVAADLSEGLLAAAPATVWVASPPFGPEVELVPAGTVWLDQLDQAATAPPVGGLVGQLGIGGLATGADIRADGTLVAVRTYDSAWLFPRSPDQSVAEALGGEPCEAPTMVEEQGEAIAFLDATTRSFVTVAEGTHPTINFTTEQG